MTKEKYLTVRMNNWLTLGMGIPTLAYVVFVLSTSVMSDFAGFVGMVVIGIVY
jgi:hypothetical protein